MWLTEMGSGPAPVFGVEPRGRRSGVRPLSAGAEAVTLRLCSGGEGGIRTPGRGLGPYDGLANRCFRPLSHLSELVRERSYANTLTEFVS